MHRHVLNLARSAFVCALACLSHAYARGAVISVNFANQSGAAYVVTNGQTYGIPAEGTYVSGWTNLVNGASTVPSSQSLPFSDGTASSVGVSGKIVGSGNFNSYNAAYSGTPLYSGLTAYVGAGYYNTITLSNLVANFPGGYKVVVYVCGYLSNTGASISDGTTTYYFRPYSSAPTPPVTPTQVTSTTPGTYQLGQYVVYGSPALLTSDTLTLTIQAIGGGGAGLCGFQIVGVSAQDLVRQWSGAVNDNWDTTTLNWTNSFYGTTNYTEGSAVLFNDQATAASPTVNLTATRSPGSVKVDSTKSYTFTGSGIVGTTGLIKQNSGTLILENANSYSGNTTISGGTLKLGTSGAIPDGAGKGSVSVGSGATLDLNGFSEGINGLSGSGTVDNTGGAAVLTVGLGGGGGTFAGTIQGATDFIKMGTNTLTLADSSSHTGATTVGQGTLVLNPAFNFSGSSALVVSNGATLSVSVANGSGLSTSSSVSLRGGVALKFDYGDASVSGGNVPITTSGALNLTGVSQISISGYKFAVGSYALINYASKTGGGFISSTPALLPTGMAATIADTGSAIVLNVTSPSSQYPPLPIGANQRATVTCFENPSFGYDIYLPPAYSTTGTPLPILYTMSPAGGGQVTPFLTTCSNLNFILVGITGSENGLPTLDYFREFYAVTMDVRHRVLYDPTAEFAGGFSGGGGSAYMLSRARAQHIAGLLEMAGSLGRGNIGTTVQYYSIDRVQTNLLVARTTGTTDTAAVFYAPFNSNFLATCNAVIKDWSFSGGHVVPADSIKSACLSWLASSRSQAPPNQRTNALAMAADWQTRIENNELGSVFRECVSNLVHLPRTWHAHEAELILDQIMTNDTAFRALDVSNLAVGNTAADYFFYYAYGAAANGDWRRYNSCMKALTGITPTNDINGTVTNQGIVVTVVMPTTNGIVYITGSDRDRDGDIYSLLINYNEYPAPALEISRVNLGQVQLDLVKDTPGLVYALESLSELPNGSWQNTACAVAETNTSWSGLVDLPATPTNIFFRISAAPLPATSPPW